MNSLQDCMLSWSFHLLVPLLFCCYAIHSCWCTPMISGHALVACVSISQWWQLSMKLFFRFYSVSFLLACSIYARRDWMLGYPCERVYALDQSNLSSVRVFRKEISAFLSSPERRSPLGCLARFGSRVSFRSKLEL